eukprot:GEMP01004936.1.p1 GENE.GEMP01004936.1~~GEMP01004936.1.p1  ORF type:complete len:1118 (+),score=198.10 GEMP01004936.1:252-3605(+)
MEIHNLLASYQTTDGRLYPREMLRLVAMVLDHIAARTSPRGDLASAIRESMITRRSTKAGGSGGTDPMAIMKLCSIFPQDVIAVVEMKRLLTILSCIEEDQDLYDAVVERQDYPWFEQWPHRFEAAHVRQILQHFASHDTSKHNFDPSIEEGTSFIMSQIPEKGGLEELERIEFYTALAYWFCVRDHTIENKYNGSSSSSRYETATDSEDDSEPSTVWFDGTEYDFGDSIQEMALGFMEAMSEEKFVGEEACAWYGIKCMYEMTKTVSIVSPKIVTEVDDCDDEYELWMDADPKTVPITFTENATQQTLDRAASSLPLQRKSWSRLGYGVAPRVSVVKVDISASFPTSPVHRKKDKHPEEKTCSEHIEKRVRVEKPRSSTFLDRGSTQCFPTPFLTVSETTVPRLDFRDTRGWIQIPLRQNSVMHTLASGCFSETLGHRIEPHSDNQNDAKDLIVFAYCAKDHRLNTWIRAFTLHWAMCMRIAREQQRQRFNRALEDLVVDMQKAETLNDVTRTITKHVCEGLGCDRGTMLFKDEMRHHLWAPISAELPAGLKIELGRGIAGIVASGGKAYTCNNPLSDSNWEGTRYNDFDTRNLLTVPVLQDWRKTMERSEDSQIFGVIQALNKCSFESPSCLVVDNVISGHGGRAFLNQWTDRDVKCLRKISEKVSKELVERLPQLLGAKVLLDGELETQRAPEMLALVSAYYARDREDSGQRSPAFPSVMRKAFISRRTTSFSNFSSEISAIDMRLSEVGKMTNYQITDWEIPYWDMEPDDQFSFVCQGIDLLCCVQDGKLAQFVDFFDSLRSSYGDTVPYHNFDHAMQTFHCTLLYVIESMSDGNASREGGRACADQLPVYQDQWPFRSHERLGLLIAALGHDADHPGRNNQFEMAIQSDLALLYNDYSVLEMHHCAVVFKLLRDHDFLSTWITNDMDVMHRSFRRLIIKAVLGTDMTLHGHHVKNAETLVGVLELTDIKSDQGRPSVHLDHRLTAIEILVHAADIGSMTLPVPIAAVFCERVMLEFTMQAQKEESLGLPITPYMQGLESGNCRERAMSQLGFIDYVVAPFWNALSQPFPHLCSPLENVKANRAVFADMLSDANKTVSEVAKAKVKVGGSGDN